MKVYVLYKDWGWDGQSEPLSITTSKMEAKLWVKQDKDHNCYKEFKLGKGNAE